MTGNTVEVITFRTTRNDHPYWFPIEALLTGTSVGHIALRFKFNNPTLYDKYIRDVEEIPKTINKFGQEVYLSFWPHEQHSKLEDHKFDCETSANYSPFEYCASFKKYLNPPRKILRSYLPLFDRLSYSVVTLPPALIIHLTPLKHTYGVRAYNLACLYAKFYDKWRRATVAEQNAEIIYSPTANKMSCFKKYTNTVNTCLIFVRMLLKQAAPEFESFVTYGSPEVDKIALPLTDDELERMLDFIRHVAENPNHYPYNIFRTNCAYISLRTLMHGFYDHLSFHHLMHNIGITITPTYLMQTLETTLSAIARQAVKPGDSIPNKDITEGGADNKEWVMISKSPGLSF